MKNSALLVALLSVAVTIPIASATPKDEVVAAAKKLADKSSYGWATTTVSPGGGFTPGPETGKADKAGAIYVTASFGDNAIEIARDGAKGAVKGQEGWMSMAEAEQVEGPGRFLGAMASRLKSPASVAADLASNTTALKFADGVYTSDLTADGVKSQLSFGGSNGPAISNPKGAVKFWVKDGLLSKYEVTLQAAMNFNGNEFPIDQVRTVEIKDIGTAAVELPADAKKKMP